MYIGESQFNHKHIEMSTKIKTFSERIIYPDLIWMSGWTFGFDPLSDPRSTPRNGTVFRTLPEKGSISGPDPESWKIHFRLPPKTHLNYFSNGFVALRRNPLAVIASPAPNVLCGVISKRYGMELQCDHRHNEANGTAHFPSDSGVASLLRNEHEGAIYFSLAVDMDSYEEADTLAKEHLAHAPENLIPLHSCRQKLVHSFDSLKKLNTLPALAGECLLKQLRVPEGVFTELWPASPSMAHEAFSLNELYPLLTAWCDIDLEYARTLYDTALNLQRMDGHFPSWVTPSGDRNSFDAPHLFFAQCAELLLQKTDDRAYAKRCLPKLNNYMRWSLRHYFPQHMLHPAGQSAAETLAPELWSKNVASVEHTLLLICELEALVQLHHQTDSPIPVFIPQALDKLTTLFETEFWNPQTRTFSFCYLREEKTALFGLHEYLPLLYKKLDRDKRNTLLAQFKLSPWAHGFQVDPQTGKQTSPATPLQQFIILQCIKTADPHNQTAAHVARTWNNLLTWQQRYFYKKLSTEMPAIDTAFICLLIDLQTLRMNLIRQSAPWVKWIRAMVHKLQLTRDDLIIVLVFSFLIFGTRMLYHNKTEATVETGLQEARASYRERDLNLTVNICQTLLETQPDLQEARLMLANILLATDAPRDAEQHYRKLRELDEDNPAFLLGLAMSLHRRGRAEEANEYYREFQDYYASFFPETSELVTRMQNLDTPKLTRYFIIRMIASDFMLTL